MLKSRRPNHQRGMASVEIVPILLLFAMLFNFSLGFFGVIHSGIINSIAARNYAFETFRNRANLNYLRDELSRPASAEMQSRYYKYGYRFHGIVGEGNNAQNWIATKRPIRFTDATSAESLATEADHKALVRMVQSSGKVSDVFDGKTASEDKAGVDPVWLQTLYGVCLSFNCQPIQ